MNLPIQRTVTVLDEVAAEQWRERLTGRRYFVGCDVGQAVDPTALSVVERVEVPLIEPGEYVDFQRVRYDQHWHLRHLERLPLGLSYPRQVEYVARRLQRVPLADPLKRKLIVDATGVGRGVVDLFKDAGLKPVALTITAGDGWSRHGHEFRVSKFTLITDLQAAIHSELLKAAEDLPDRAAFEKELTNFHVTLSENTGAARFSAREGEHDDLVLSVAIAFWYGRNAGGTVTTRNFF